MPWYSKKFPQRLLYSWYCNRELKKHDLYEWLLSVLWTLRPAVVKGPTELHSCAADSISFRKCFANTLADFQDDASKILSNGQFVQKEALGLMPLTSWALHWSAEREPAWAMVSLRKNDMAFFVIAFDRTLGDTNRDLGLGETPWTFEDKSSMP